MNRGFLIIALGHPNYGRMAHNLAASIKAVENIPIAFVHGDGAINHLSTYDLSKTFDYVIECPPEYYLTKGVTEYIKAKTHIYDLSPFEKTIYLDADMIWLNKKPSELFSLFSTDFEIKNSGFEQLAVAPNEYSQWVGMKEVREKYGSNGKYFCYHSEVIYFIKSAGNKFYFEKVKEVFNNKNLQYKKFSLTIPDEPAYSIASAVLNHYPSLTPFMPSYWVHNGRKTEPYDKIMEDYFLISMGGAFQPLTMIDRYNKIAKIAFQKLGLVYPYQHKNKRMFLKERQTI